MTIIRAAMIDPGLRESALVRADVEPGALKAPWGITVLGAEIVENARLRSQVGALADSLRLVDAALRPPAMTNELDLLIVEVQATIYGRAPRKGTFSAGADQIATERWAGRFLGVAEERGARTIEITRPNARAAIARAGGLKAKDVDDAAVRRVLIDAYGGKLAAFGKRCGCAKLSQPGYRRGVPCECCVRRREIGDRVIVTEPTTWEVPRGPFHGWTGSHLFAALALGFAAFETGGAYYQGAAP